MNRFKIMDHHISKNEVSLLIPRSYYSIEKEIKSIQYIAPPIPKEQRVEMNNQFPPFVLTFYNFIFNAIQKNKSHIIPTGEELSAAYFAQNKELIPAPNSFVLFKGEYYDARFLKGRLLRSYPSIVRDFQFVLIMEEYLQKSANYCHICYDSKIDLEGIDAVISNGAMHYNMGLCVYNERSKDMIKGKKQRMKGASLTIPDGYFGKIIRNTGDHSIECWTWEDCQKILKKISWRADKKGEKGQVFPL